MIEKHGMDILDVIGNFGRFQVDILLVISLKPIFTTTIYFLVHMMSSNTDFWCSPVTPYQNLSVQEWKDCCIPKSSGKFSQCQRYGYSSDFTVHNDTLEECHEWEYAEQKQASLRSEWDLVCDRKWLLSLLYSMFFLGNLVSYPISGFLADRVGRKPAILFGCFGLAVTSLVVSLSNTFMLFMIFRALQGFTYTFVYQSLETIYMEVCGRKERAFNALVIGLLYPIVTVVMIFSSVNLSSWRYFSFSGCFCLFYMIIVFKFCPESLRWLVVCKKTDRAKALLKVATRKNGIKIQDTDSVLKSLEDKRERVSEERSSIRDVFRYQKLIYVYIIIVLSHVTNKLISSGYLISLRSVGGDYHTNFLIISGIGFLTNLIRSFLLYKYTKRRITLLVAFSTTGILFFISTMIGEDLLWLRITLAMIAMFTNSLTSHALTIFLAEVCPTKMRTRAKSICNTAGRVGSFFSSFTDLLSQVYGNNASMYLFGAMSLLTSFAYIFVPEMDNTNLPDSMEEANRNLKPAVGT